MLGFRLDLSGEPRLFCGEAFRSLGTDDFSAWSVFIAEYRSLCEQSKASEAELKALGVRVFDWLNGSLKWLDPLRDQTAPYRAWFCVSLADLKDRNAHAQAFLDVPWELATPHAEKPFWAINPNHQWLPIRRVGQADDSFASSPHRLALLFMASSPRNVSPILDFEAEEAAILQATEGVGLDLVAEESGNLEELVKRFCLDDDGFDVVHLSCHGLAKDLPILSLEDPFGNHHEVMALDMHQAFSRKPPLTFLSACQTARSSEFVQSMASDLLVKGFPGVVAWADSVADQGATAFASGFYMGLARRDSLSLAFLAGRNEAHRVAFTHYTSSTWHLARLYLGSLPDVPLIASTSANPKRKRANSERDFLDVANQAVPVASQREFVGRRRFLQDILRTFNQPNREHAGIIIHGIGNQGKSSLAARVAQRMPSHQPVVIFKHYSEADFRRAIEEATHSKAVREIFENESDFRSALIEVLEDPCAQTRPNERGRIVERPILLIIDDFERILELPKDKQSGNTTLEANHVAVIQAVIAAFDQAETESRLLITSRYLFDLEHNGRNLAEKLKAVPLTPMNRTESRKQFKAKPEGQLATNQMDAIHQVSGGNPGLQSLLYGVANQDQALLQNCLEQMSAYLAEGKQPENQEVQNWLENLLLGEVQQALNEDERSLLKLSQVFEMPIPRKVMAVIEAAFGLKAGAGERLIGFGLWEVYEDVMDRQVEAVLINPLVKAKQAGMAQADYKKLAEASLDALIEAWGGIEKGKRWASCDLELSRLAVVTERSDVINACGANAVFLLNNRNQYREGAALGQAMIAIYESQKQFIDERLLRATAQCLWLLGQPHQAKTYLEQALNSQSDRTSSEYAFGLFEIARLQVQAGEIETAKKGLEQSIKLLSKLDQQRDLAISKGVLAQIHALQGQLEHALNLFQEALTVYETLGDLRSRAITLSDIARIHYQQGQLDHALNLFQEALTVYETLGDLRSRAVTLGRIAAIYSKQGDWQRALTFLEEELDVYQSLGDLGSKAATLYQIAQIDLQQQQIETALERLVEAYQLNHKVQRLDGICFVADLLGQILCAAGNLEQGMPLLNEALAGFQHMRMQTQADAVRQAIAHYKAQSPDT